MIMLSEYLMIFGLSDEDLLINSTFLSVEIIFIPIFSGSFMIYY